jgi:capsular exopolysaccharide synthesis family protein
LDATTSYAVSDERDPEGGQRGLGPLLRYALALIRRNLLLIGAILALAIALAVVLTMLQTPRYTATASVEINQETQKVLGDKLESGTEASTPSYDFDLFLNTELEILRSRALAERVVQRLNLAANDRFFAAMQVPAAAGTGSAAQRRELAIALVQGGFSVDVPRETRVAHLTFESTDPQISAAVANAFATEFIQANLQRKFDSSAYARNFVSEQLEQARVRLEDSERQLNGYARQAGLIRTREATESEGESAGSVTASSLMQLNKAANDAQAERIAAEARWSAERAQPLFSSSAVLASPIVQTLMQRRADAQSRLEAARARYLPDHPTVLAAKAEYDAAQAGLTRAANEARDAVRAQYLSAASAERRLKAQVGSLQGATLAEQDRAVRYNTLAREADTNRQIYDGLLSRYRELNAAAGITASNIAVIDPAQTPTTPSSPNLTRNILLALLLGSAFAAALVFLRDELDDRLRVPEDVEAKLHLPLLGVIPLAPKGEDPRALLDDAKSPLAESYNALRTTLMYSTREGLPRILLVTSAQAAEGKTTTSFAIARAFARIGKRVLLVDADLRRPSVHKAVGVSNRKGLSSVLIGEATLQEAAAASDTEGLTVLPAGPIPPSPAELLSSPRMAALLEQLETMFDVVVIDSSPVLGLADSTELAALADGVMLVIEADRGRGGQLKSALRRLRNSHPVIVGAALTKFDPDRAGNDYSAYYGYDYYRYHSEEAEGA